MTSRLVTCKKFGQELPGLASPPFAGELGKQIYENVSERAWKSWKDDMMIKVINEYRLNMGDKQHYELLLLEMKKFLGLEVGPVKEVENAERGMS